MGVSGSILSYSSTKKNLGSLVGVGGKGVKNLSSQCNSALEGQSRSSDVQSSKHK